MKISKHFLIAISLSIQFLLVGSCSVFGQQIQSVTSLSIDDMNKDWPSERKVRKSKVERYIKKLTKKIEKKEDLANNFVSRGILYGRLGDVAKAKTDFDSALSEDSNSVLALVNRAYCWMLLKKYPEALDDYNAALDVAPEEAYIYNSRGYFYYLQRQLSRSLKDFAMAAILDPNDRVFQANLEKVESEVAGES